MPAQAPSMAPTSGRSSCTGSMAAGTSISPPRQGYDPAACTCCNRGDDPFGSYAFPQETDAGKISDASDKWAIPMAQCWNTRASAASSGRAGRGRQRAAAHLHRQDGLPWRLAGARVEISRPELAWERIGTPRSMEAPSPAGPGRASSSSTPPAAVGRTIIASAC